MEIASGTEPLSDLELYDDEFYVLDTTTLYRDNNYRNCEKPIVCIFSSEAHFWRFDGTDLRVEPSLSFVDATWDVNFRCGI